MSPAVARPVSPTDRVQGFQALSHSGAAGSGARNIVGFSYRTFGGRPVVIVRVPTSVKG
ncbi:hypothetical protein [Palleronia rufa]|uniref:hypothetical protein n=1 Tax=Palleronia rufa TaxID=1530186 RepID=UPI0039EFA522